MIKTVYNSLNKQERVRLLLLSLFTFFSIIVELFGLSLIIPISKLFLDDNYYSQILNQYHYFEILKSYNKDELIISVIIIFFLIFTLKTFFLTLLSYSKFYFINKYVKSKTIELYGIYLNQNISFINKNHSSKKIKNLIGEMNVLKAFYNSLIILFSEILFILIIIIGIIYYNFILFFYLASFILVLFVTFKFFFKNKIFHWGIERQSLEEKIIKQITESLGALKELIIYDKTHIFESRVKTLYSKKFKLDVRFATINDIPKYFIELAAIIGFTLLIIILILGGIEKNNLLVTLVFFSALLFKGLPSVSRIINSTQQIKFYYPTLELIQEEISKNKKLNLKVCENVKFKENISLKNISFSYDNKIILNDISISIDKGEKAIIIGKSGRGKSTLIDIISGFHHDFGGEFLVDNKELKNFKNWRKNIGYLSQSFFILDDTIKNNIILDNKYDEEKFNKIIDICKLKDLINYKNAGVNELIGERGGMLSGGEKQRIGLARSLYHDPEILILDEPTSSLDKETSDEFINSILNLDAKLTIIMVSHDQSIKDKFDKIITL